MFGLVSPIDHSKNRLRQKCLIEDLRLSLDYKSGNSSNVKMGIYTITTSSFSVEIFVYSKPKTHENHRRARDSEGRAYFKRSAEKYVIF